MEQKVCGIDVHRDLLVATILLPLLDNNTQQQQKQTRKFQNSQTDMQQLKDWLNEHQCKKVAMESTSIYWITLYHVLEDAGFQPILANARQVKGIPGRKTDQTDSEWLAHILKADLIKPSYIPPKHLQDLRTLTRLRVKYVQNRTQFKNRCQKLLNQSNIRLSSKLSDIFGKAGIEILNGLMEGKTIEEILTNTKNKWLVAKKDELTEVAKGSLGEVDMFVLDELTRSADALTVQIQEIEAKMERLVNERDMKVVCSVPGVGKLAATTILAELGDPKRFNNDKQVAAWSGFAPSVCQSAGVTRFGGITKQGSRWLRRIMVEVAHVAVRMDCRFKRMFWRITVNKGKKVAYVAVARKLLTVVWHLLVNGELYVEEKFSKATVLPRSKCVGSVLTLDGMVTILKRAGYTVSANG
jgi:transposase